MVYFRGILIYKRARELLPKLRAGGSCGNTVNNLMYADSSVLFSPSAKGQQMIIDVQYAIGLHMVMFNSSKLLVFFSYIEICSY